MNSDHGTIASMKTFCSAFSAKKYSAIPCRLPLRAGSKCRATFRRYLSWHRSATLRAEGRLQGGAMDKPAPHTRTRRAACIDASNLSLTSGVNRLALYDSAQPAGDLGLRFTLARSLASRTEGAGGKGGPTATHSMGTIPHGGTLAERSSIGPRRPEGVASWRWRPVATTPLMIKM